MSECKHEPWLNPNPVLTAANDGVQRPWDVSGFLKPPAYVCRHCGVVYVPKDVRDNFDRSAARVGEVDKPTVAEVVGAALRKSKGEGGPKA